MALETIATKRMCGERPRSSHRPFFRSLLTDPDVAKTLWPGEHGGPRTRQQADELLAEDIFHWQRHGFGPWVFTERCRRTPLGRGGLQVTTVDGRPHVEVVYAIRSDRWNEGYATEIAAAALVTAQEHERIDEIVALTLLTNYASQRVMRKIGLRFDREVQHAGLPHMLFRAAV